MLARLSNERLAAVPLLAGLAPEVLEGLKPHLYERTFAPREQILREGEYCDGAYYLLEGRAEVRLGRQTSAPAVAAPPDTPKPVPALFNRVARMLGRPVAEPATPSSSVTLIDLPTDMTVGSTAIIEAGDIFGEGSALSRYPIATDIVALTEVQCLLIRTPALRAMLDLEELASFKKIFDDRYRQRTLRSHLRRVSLFSALPATALDEIADHAELLTFKPGRVIAKQGDAADTLMLVRGGYIKVSVRTGETDMAATYLRKGDWVGETALLLDEPWPFTLTALEHVELVRLARPHLDELRAAFPDVEQQMWRTLTSRLKQVGGTVHNPRRTEKLQFAMDSGLIHGESVLLIDLERCTRCDDCVRACADAHDGIPRFVREGIKFRNFSVPSACYQCTDPVCMIGCPTGAIERPLGTLEVSIDKNTCIGCGNCVRRCPWDNIRAVPYNSPATGTVINLATKCDLCIGRGAGPACVQACPHGAAVRVNFKDDERVDRFLDRL